MHEEIEGFEKLKTLALDLLWAWHHGSDDIWKELDQDLWKWTHNPWVILQTVSRAKVEQKLADPAFCAKVNEFLQIRENLARAPAWFQKTHPDSPLKCVAYFSMEFMLSEALPIYSGGLGNVAGDQLKAASDLGVPVVGITLLYQQGYFRQLIDKEGNQQAFYPFNEPAQLPISPVRKADGEWLRIEIVLPGWSMWLRVWEATVGKVKLYLLDTNDPSNYPAHRGIASELYGGDVELRLKQELVLGVGGWRLLDLLGLDPEVCHLNEGHAAFAVLERACCAMKKMGLSFHEAFAITRAGNHFTTHTAVPAGFDRFSPALMQQYLDFYCKSRLRIPLEELLALGRQNPDDREEYFNMAYFALRSCCSANGVSLLHGQVSRELFQQIFPRWPQEEIPIGALTNGVHMPSWDSLSADALWTKACGKERWHGTCTSLEEAIRGVPDETIWQMRNDSRKALILYTRSHLSRIWAARGLPPEEVEEAKSMFDPNVLTIGFSRRFATYKRVTLLLHDPARLIRILKNPDRPVQLLLAGKAHPADKPGQAMIREWVQFKRQSEVRKHIIYLSDYDMHMTEHFVQGVDVWINTPRRPWEACGTSGMKVLVNGGLNLSELDGWWAEAYRPEVGWALGDGQEHGNDPAWDAHEANDLYDLLEKEVVPEFYTRDERGMPKRWLNRIRESMATLTPRFAANRTVSDYTERYYLPAAARFRERVANPLMGKKLADWQKMLAEHWKELRFESVNIITEGQEHRFEVKLYPGSIDPEHLQVQLYANGSKLVEMKQGAKSGDSLVYQASAPTTRPASDYTARVIPQLPGLCIPLELPYILWQN